MTPPEDSPQSNPPVPDRSGRGRVLLLEDDALLAKCFAQLLITVGVAEVATARTNAAALEILADADIVAAFLDVRLESGTSKATALALAARDIPFCFVSGQALPKPLDEDFPAANVLPKPARKKHILGMLKTLDYQT